MKFKAFVVMGVFLMTASVLIGCSKPSMGQRMDWMIQKISHEMELTKDQQTVVSQIKEDFFQKVKAQKDARLQLRNDMIDMVKSDAIDPAKMEAAKQKMNDLNKELQDFLTSKMVDFHKTMTPAQKAKAAEWMLKMSEHMMDMM
jgi:Spy/CpxP family protein refolding chaperone